MLKTSLWGINAFNTNAASSCFQLLFDGNKRERISSMGWPIFFPTPFLSLQFWNLTFASLPPFQTGKGAERYVKCICALQGTDGPVLQRSERLWKWVIMCSLTGMERAGRCRARHAHFTGFYSAWKASPVFPWKKTHTCYLFCCRRANISSGEIIFS